MRGKALVFGVALVFSAFELTSPCANASAVPSNRHELFVDGCKAFEKGKFQEAIEKLTTYVDADSLPVSYEAIAFLAQSLSRAGRADSGRAVLARGVLLARAVADSNIWNVSEDLLRWSREYPGFPDELKRENGFSPKHREEEPRRISLSRISASLPLGAWADQWANRSIPVLVLIDVEGVPVKGRLQNAMGVPAEIAEAAVAAALTTRFTPFRRYGRPFAAWVLMPITFIVH